MSPIVCAKCMNDFRWDEAYWQQNTPGSDRHAPPGHGDFRPRVFCPHCGFLIAEWDVDRHEDRDRWKWYEDNEKVNAEKELPPSPLSMWGHQISAVPYSDKRIDIKAPNEYERLSPEQPDTGEELDNGYDQIEKALLGLKDRIAVIPKQYAAKGFIFGPGAGQAQQQIPIICHNIDDAVGGLKTGRDLNGNPITPGQVGIGLQNLIEATRRPNFDLLLVHAINIEGLIKLKECLKEMEKIARRIQDISK